MDADCFEERLYQGYLIKQKKEGKRHFFSPFTKRYFELDLESRTFGYKERPMNPQLKEKLNIEGLTDIIGAPLVNSRPKEAPFCFQVKFGDRSFVLFANSDSVKQYWLSGFKRALAIKNEEKIN